MLRLALLAAISVALAGCSMGAVIQVEGSAESPAFRFITAGLLGGRSLDFPGSLTVSDGVGRTMWSINADRLSALPVKTIRYGEVPPGAIEGAAAEPLKTGVAYEIRVSGGGYDGLTRFRIVQGRAERIHR